MRDGARRATNSNWLNKTAALNVVFRAPGHTDARLAADALTLTIRSSQVKQRKERSDSSRASAFLALPLCLDVAKRRVSALLQGKFDAFHQQVMDFAPLIERDLAQRFIGDLWQVDARMLDESQRAPGIREQPRPQTRTVQVFCSAN
jgi:hypothetical protein